MPGRLCVWPCMEQLVLGEGRVGTNASVQGENEQVFKCVSAVTSLSAIHEPKLTLQG